MYKGLKGVLVVRELTVFKKAKKIIQILINLFDYS
jgi:hypothetical protein